MALLLDRGDCDHCRTFHARATSYFRISASATQHEHFGPCSRCRSEQCGSRIVHNAPPLKTTNYPRARLASSATRAKTEEVETHGSRRCAGWPAKPVAAGFIGR